jgi:plastocyanin
MADYDISIDSSGDPSPSIRGANPGDKITWTNNYSEAVTSFSLPTCVSPQTDPAPIAVGTTTRKYTVNNGSSGTYDYSYVTSAATDPHSGTIDVG